MQNYNQPERNYKPVHINKLPPNNWRFAFFNRQSGEKNAHGHKRHLPMLEKAHARLSPDEPFNPHSFTDSGDIKILRNAFNSSDIDAVLAGTYFEGLANVLKHELQNAQKLCVVFPSIDRIFRPLGYDRHGGKSTWVYTDEDFVLFHRWLEYVFGERAADIQFTVLDDSSPRIIRANSIKSGQAVSGNSGGRPKTINPQDEVCRLRIAHDWKSGQIRRYLLKQYKIDVSDKSIQRWLRAKDLQAKPGRPRREK